MRFAVLPGDGIGPEITAATIAVLDTVDARLGLRLQYQEHEVGLAALKRVGTTTPEGVIAACRAADGIILGPVSHSEYPTRAEGGINISAELRVVLDLYANIRPARSRQGLPHYGRTGMDLVIVRENTEGFYSDRNMHWGVGEFMPTPDLALSVRKITAEGSRRIARAAFDLAARRERKKVTAVHKVNVIKISEALFLREVRAVAQEFPGIAYEEQLIDSMAALLVRDAERFDVVVTTNMFGDILSDEASELSGSLGLAGAINASATHCMAQAQHGSAPDIAGQDKANPVSLILSAAMLLDWLARQAPGREGFVAAARAIEAAVDALLADPARRTPDLGGPLGTRAYTAALCEEIGRRLVA
ncbi:isocitrate/isopropylmalate dehydrogenase family protein [Plastoroseomonas hellenica]|uniref:isocitrate/isopropylmalate dehydrogenase family protein n=1 Tax=Plastoroseomonas hellenica TaxID=2687306 RepID=UPI001BA77AAB|nr:isocitrate/isopropylmalate dehydrogenase family protein [Plastoroseomonas hellenica]MBR0646817.1 isocitrate/isopropylmalate dehydrogenase family protein [Plastoroseomonas hellenica]